MIGTPTSSETLKRSLNFLPIRASKGRKRRPVWPVAESPKFQRMSVLG
jgi:hypothetical protein